MSKKLHSNTQNAEIRVDKTRVNLSNVIFPENRSSFPKQGGKRKMIPISFNRRFMNVNITMILRSYTFKMGSMNIIVNYIRFDIYNIRHENNNSRFIF